MVAAALSQGSAAHRLSTPTTACRPAIRWTSATFFALVTGTAQAQISCNAELAYAPLVATPVPSLATWGVLALSSMLGLMAVRRMRNGGMVMHQALLPGIVALIVAAGLVAHQALADNFDASDPAGGTLVFASQGPHTVTNTSGVRLRIATLTAGPGFEASTNCQPGQVLAPGASCQVTLGSCGGTGGTGGD